ncbi:hypothetical protein MKK67_11265 [Methylobacterium sp. J-072]|uniref:hypothetical protein n=1 Tax=Methylobacterium sp. J-072 TaxID=2836651 RepID=UPI001FBA81DA|nr:hypothetical protein [Methylobacterium sp. J-072]MCJ2093073.1 hypothetical protein [Methylobacterium sp. J-072]
MSDADTKHIYCATDQAKANLRIGSDDSKTVECPACGQSDTLEEATADAMRGMLQGMIGDTFRGSKNITVSRPGPAPCWILAD